MKNQIETEQVTEVSFVDKNKERFNVTITIKNEEKGKTLSICSEGGQHRHVPANEPQQRLLSLWEKWHLNDMKAGTIAQEAAIQKWKAEGNKGDYTAVCEYLSGLKPDGTPLSVHEFQKIFNSIGVLEKKLEKTDKILLQFQKELAEHKEGWFFFDFKSIEFSHKNIRDKALGINKQAVYIDYNFSKKGFETKVLNPFKTHFNALREELNTLRLSTLLWDGSIEHPHEYGGAWLLRVLPEDIEEQIDEIVQEINDAEEERKGESLKDLTDEQLVELIVEKTTHEELNALRVAAAVRMFDLTENDFDDIEIDTRCDYRVEIQRTDYLLGNEEEMTEALTEDIKQSLFAFNANFLATQTDMPQEVFEALQPQCESANDAIERLIDKTCGMEEFVEAAEAADGRGHFLNRYDGTEQKITVLGQEFFAYRN